MAELKVGYQAVFYKGEEKISTHPVKETYEAAVKVIEDENESITKHKTKPFTHAQVEKVYYRH